MSKRFIRLKELRPNLNRIYVPDESYLVNRDKLNKKEVYTVNTNQDGNQISPWGYKLLEQEVYLIGDSSVESIYVRATMRPHSVLEKKLLSKGYSCNVYNLGVSGAQTLNIVNLIINKLGNKKGAVVVVSIPSNDASTLVLKDNYYSDHWRYSSIVPASNRNSEHATEIDYHPFEKNIQMIIELCHILKLKLYMTSIIHNDDNKHYKKLNHIGSEICYKKNVPFIDLEKEFKVKEVMFYDSLHFLPFGSSLFAECLYNFIEKNCLIITLSQ